MENKIDITKSVFFAAGENVSLLTDHLQKITNPCCVCDQVPKIRAEIDAEHKSILLIMECHTCNVAEVGEGNRDEVGFAIITQQLLMHPILKKYRQWQDRWVRKQNGIKKKAELDSAKRKVKVRHNNLPKQQKE